MASQYLVLRHYRLTVLVMEASGKVGVGQFSLSDIICIDGVREYSSLPRKLMGSVDHVRRCAFHVDGHGRFITAFSFFGQSLTWPFQLLPPGFRA
jgi:hypothetical protein